MAVARPREGLALPGVIVKALLHGEYNQNRHRGSRQDSASGNSSSRRKERKTEREVEGKHNRMDRTEAE